MPFFRRPASLPSSSSSSFGIFHHPKTLYYDVAEAKRRRRCKLISLLSAFGIVGLLAFLCWRVIPPGAVERAIDGATNVIHHDAFERTHHVFVSEVDADMVVYQHRKTKTQVMTLIPVDTTQDSTFGISFRTIPHDNTGVAHILEHSVLDGSVKYPSKDPFNQLLRGSLQTFLNAFTFADRTAYVLSSRNRADFFNLMSVYLDAVFQPRCVLPEHKWIFRQEGWRVEQNENENTTMFELNGVVMNEMKGAYSNPDELIHRYAQTKLFPDTTYQYESGGEPLSIPTLQYEDFVDFYKNFYHPTNAKVYLFGPKAHVQDGLHQLDYYLQMYDAQTEVAKMSQVGWQRHAYDQPERQQVDFPSSSDDSDYRVLVSWLLHTEKVDRLTEIAWYIVSEILLGSPSSVLTNALIQSGYGEDVLGDGVEDGLQQWTFQVGLQGIRNEADIPMVENVILSTLESVVTDGIDADDVASAINTVEFQLRELSTGNYPRGVIVFLQALMKWNYDIDPAQALEFESALNKLKTLVQDEGFTIFTSLISDRLINNQHRVVTELFPSSVLEEQHLDEEHAFVAELMSQLPSDQFQGLLHESTQLSDMQNTIDPPESLAAIPALTLDDLDRRGDEYPITVTRQNNVLLVTHAVESSYDIAYVDFGLDMSVLDFGDIALVPLLSRLILQSGTATLDEVEITREIRKYTGDIDIIPLVVPIQSDQSSDYFKVTDGRHLYSKIFVRTRCFTENVSEMFDLIGKLIFKGRLFAQDKTLALLKEFIAEKQDAVKTRGHRFVKHRLEAHSSVSGYVDELLHGVSGLQQLSQLLDTATSDWDAVSQRLEAMRTELISGNRNGIVLNLTGDRRVIGVTAKQVDKFLESTIPANSESTPFPDFSTEEHPWVALALPDMEERLAPREGFVTSTRVSYVGMSGMLYGPQEMVPGSAAAVTHYLENGYLYENLRLKRGAYGAFAYLRRDSGSLEFLTYRDPNLLETLDVFNGTDSFLLEQLLETEELPPAAHSVVIGSIGSLDGSAPQPDQLGWDSLHQFLRGETAEQRQTWRNQILNTNRQDYLDYAQRLHALGFKDTAAVSSQSKFDELIPSNTGFDITYLDQ